MKGDSENEVRYVSIREIGGKIARITSPDAFTGTEVSESTWRDGLPTTNGPAPEGYCMFLDGFEEYASKALPCQNIRKFVCQMPFV